MSFIYLLPFGLELVIDLFGSFLIDSWNLHEDLFICLYESRFRTCFLLSFYLILNFLFYQRLLLRWQAGFRSDISRHTLVYKSLLINPLGPLAFFLYNSFRWASVVVSIDAALWIEDSTHSPGYCMLLFDRFLLLFIKLQFIGLTFLLRKLWIFIWLVNAFLAIIFPNVAILLEPLIFFKLLLKFLVLGFGFDLILSHLNFRLFNLLFIESGRCLLLRHAQPGATLCISSFGLTSISQNRWITTIFEDTTLHDVWFLHCFETLILITFIHLCILPWVHAPTFLHLFILFIYIIWYLIQK